MGKPQDYSPILNGVMWSQTLLASIFVALRFYTRRCIVRNLGWDDVVMVANLCTFVAYVGTTSVATYYGLGKTTLDINRLGLNQSKAILWEVICQGVCVMGIAVSKASVALLLLRIVVTKWHIYLLWTTIFTTSVFCCVTTVLLFLQCKPAAFLWNHRLERGYCWLNFTDVALAMGAWSAVMDFVLVALPWHVVMALRIKRKEKITIACGLSLGVLAGACSIVRTVELNTLSSMDNYVYETAPMLLWSSSEVCLSIICACIPTLRPLYLHIVRGGRDRSQEQSYTFHENQRPQSYTLNEYSKVGREIYTGNNVRTGREIYVDKVIAVESEVMESDQGSANIGDTAQLRSKEMMTVSASCTYEKGRPQA